MQTGMQGERPHGERMTMQIGLLKAIPCVMERSWEGVCARNAASVCVPCPPILIGQPASEWRWKVFPVVCRGYSNNRRERPNRRKIRERLFGRHRSNRQGRRVVLSEC
jgi:hypothetical protein